MNIATNEPARDNSNAAQAMADRIRTRVVRKRHGLFLCLDELCFAIKWHDVIYDGDESTNMDSGIYLQPRNDETDTQLFYERDFASYIMKLRSFYTGPREEWPDEYHNILSAMEIHGIIVSSGGGFDCPDALRVPLDNGAVYPNA